MNFPFRTAKATEVAASFIEKAGGSINIMKLVKLIYLLDRESLDKRGIPIVGGWYLSMKSGPVTSEILDLINNGYLGKEKDDLWEKHISSRSNHTVKLISPIKPCYISEGEEEMIVGLWKQHGSKDQWQLRDRCHTNCPEWTEIADSYKEISLGRLTAALGMDDDKYQHVQREADELKILDEIFSGKA